MSAGQTSQQMNKFAVAFISAILLTLAVIVGSTRVGAANSNIIVMQDGLANGWANWSSAVVDLRNQQHVRQGNSSLSANFRNRGDFVLLHTYATITGSSVDAISFWARGNLGNVGVSVIVADSSGNWSQPVQIMPPSSAWEKFNITMEQLGNPEDITSIIWQNDGARQPPTFYMDDIRLVSSGSSLLNGVTPLEIRRDSGGSLVDALLSPSSEVEVSEVEQAVESVATEQDAVEAEPAVRVLSGDSIVDANVTESTVEDEVLADSAESAPAETVVEQAQVVVPNPIVPATPQPTPLPQPTPTPQAVQSRNTWASSGGVIVNVNTVSHQIDPNIYGVNFADEALAREIRLSVNRWGGNATTRFNYLNNTSNRASDWYFENIPGEDPGTLPVGNDSDLFIEQNMRTDTDVIMTMPLIGWTAKDAVRRCGYSMDKYGMQDGADPWFLECGDGMQNGAPILDNDPLDTSEPINEAFVQGWVRYLNERFGPGGGGGVRYLSLDNEPFLWNHTHRDVRPNGVGYDELRDLTYRYASAIKQIDPTAMTLGPVLWGWTAFEFSAVDAESNNWDFPPDRLAHGDIPFVPWYLQQMALYERNHGVRILDYLDLHFYPQSPGVGLSDVGDRATQELRMRSTRLLWDKSYIEEYWIEEPTYLIPNMHNWVNANYPGTKLSLTEYNWGGLESMNGAVAQADILGIFGREALDMAALWAPGEAHQPWAYAFKMYRNYDGNGSQFGDQSLAVGSPDAGVYGVYAARRSSDGAVTLMVVNKSWESVELTVQLQGLNGGGTAEVFRYSEANLNAIERLDNGPFNGNQFAYRFPGQSITLFVVK